MKHDNEKDWLGDELEGQLNNESSEEFVEGELGKGESEEEWDDESDGEFEEEWDDEFEDEEFDDEDDEYDEDEFGDDEIEDGINMLFDFITGFALRKLELDESDDLERMVVFMSIDCESKGVGEEETVGYILAKLMGMGFYLSEENVRGILADVKAHCQVEIMAYKIAVDALYEQNEHPADVLMKVNQLLEQNF